MGGARVSLSTTRGKFPMAALNVSSYLYLDNDSHKNRHILVHTRVPANRQSQGLLLGLLELASSYKGVVAVLKHKISIFKTTLTLG